MKHSISKLTNVISVIFGTTIASNCYNVALLWMWLLASSGILLIISRRAFAKWKCNSATAADNRESPKQCHHWKRKRETNVVVFWDPLNFLHIVFHTMNLLVKVGSSLCNGGKLSNSIFKVRPSHFQTLLHLSCSRNDACPSLTEILKFWRRKWICDLICVLTCDLTCDLICHLICVLIRDLIRDLIYDLIWGVTCILISEILSKTLSEHSRISITPQRFIEIQAHACL